MIDREKIVQNSDSLMELLAAQCADLEKLLFLAREENVAAQQGNFEDILQIVSLRAEIGDRLEVFQQQIAELRRNLKADETSVENIKRRSIEIANLTIAQDQKTQLLLTDAKAKTATELANLGKSQRGTSAYLREETKGLSCNRNF